MQLWCRAVNVGGFACQQGSHQQHARSKHHGQQTHGEYFAVRGLLQHGKPYGNCSDRCQAWGNDADALHPRYPRALGARGAHRVAWQYAKPAKQLQTHVHVGGRHSGCCSWTIY